jgi:hypothetical protein
LCTMHCNKNTAMQKAIRRRAKNTALLIRIPRTRAKTVNIICDVAYDVIDSTYNIAYDEYSTTL